ncbi:hypothetical protein LS72_005745 [Helicobacter apodemus]|uniref:Uncharacterized protein n=1 Tax=Helicobacter apodemus TaxID=135569 RepID=A0A4U8UE98_9HELI|nr:hypothetical protein [Helicobacter apodemus]TLE15737.1 hypothetical protein LS72_005745 [Helicobacter apodemus]
MELWGMIGIDTIIDIVDNCVMNKNFFRVYQTSWKLFFKRMLRIKNNEKKRVVLIFLILFALPALCISLQYWVEVGIFIALLIILLPLMGFLYFPIFHKYPITPFLIIAILLLVYLLLDAFLLFAFYTLGDIFTGWFD